MPTLNEKINIKHRISPRDLGIDIVSQKEEELFKWFLVCILFSKPIQEKIVIKAYFELINNNLTSSQKVLDAGWDKLVGILDSAHYVRYDFSTAARIINICKELENIYQGKVSNILRKSKTKHDLKQRLEKFDGIGPITASIFVNGLG
jgi:endonuclease III